MRGIGERPVRSSDTVFTSRSREVLRLSVAEARKLGDSEVTPSDLLLGLAREGDGIGAGILESAGVSLDKIRGLVVKNRRVAQSLFLQIQRL